MNETTSPTLTAELIAPARDLLRLSLAINGSGTDEKPLLPKHHVIYAASALSCLLHGTQERWSDYTPLMRAIAKQEQN